jgi:hypothetical protein
MVAGTESGARIYDAKNCRNRAAFPNSIKSRKVEGKDDKKFVFDKRHINVSVPKTNFLSSFPSTFLDLIEFGNAARFLQFFASYIRAPLSVPRTMHIVNSINSIRLHFIHFDSFIQWNQTDPAALSILTHSVPLVSVLPTQPLRKIRKNLHSWQTFVLFHSNALYPF